MEPRDVNGFRKWSLAVSESVDAWRIVPRAILIGYGVLVYHLIGWFFEQATYVKRECDTAVLETLLKHNTELSKAQEIACQVVDVVGGPTTAQASFIGAIVGLATVVIGFYTTSGRDWQKSVLPWKFGKTKEEPTSKVLNEEDTSD